MLREPSFAFSWTANKNLPGEIENITKMFFRNAKPWFCRQGSKLCEGFQNPKKAVVKVPVSRVPLFVKTVKTWERWNISKQNKETRENRCVYKIYGLLKVTFVVLP